MKGHDKLPLGHQPCRYLFKGLRAWIENAVFSERAYPALTAIMVLLVSDVQCRAECVEKTLLVRTPMFAQLTKCCEQAYLWYDTEVLAC